MNAPLPGFYIEEHISTAMLSDVTRARLTEELDRIFREHHLMVYRTARAVTGSREDAKDIAQTIFRRLLRRDVPPDIKKNPKGYLYRAAVNLSLNTIRSRRRHAQVDDAESFEKVATFAWAYPVPNVPNFPPFFKCELFASIGFVSGGPEWVRTETWDIEAAIPDGAFSDTPDFYDPKLQQMRQTLLADRFKVVVRRETREMPVYALRVGKNGPKFNGHGERYAAASSRPNFPATGIALSGRQAFEAWNVSMASWVEAMIEMVPRGGDRLFVDRTGLSGKYDFHLYRDTPLPQNLGANLDLHREAVQAMGLELNEMKAPFEVLVIERAEKPSEN